MVINDVQALIDGYKLLFKLWHMVINDVQALIDGYKWCSSSDIWL